MALRRRTEGLLQQDASRPASIPQPGREDRQGVYRERGGAAPPYGCVYGMSAGLRHAETSICCPWSRQQRRWLDARLQKTILLLPPEPPPEKGCPAACDKHISFEYCIPKRDGDSNIFEYSCWICIKQKNCMKCVIDVARQSRHRQSNLQMCVSLGPLGSFSIFKVCYQQRRKRDTGHHWTDLFNQSEQWHVWHQRQPTIKFTQINVKRPEIMRVI